MVKRQDGSFARQFRALYDLGAIRHLTDGQLLERFLTGAGEPAELAFAALVERHAALVMSVCRSALPDPNDAHDAFQATFLLLLRKARGLWVRDSLGPWLHQVAVRTARGARSSAARRRRLERSAAVNEAIEPSDPQGWVRTLHEEIDRLPARYRLPIVLCDLQGHSCEEAARRIGCAVGTVKSLRSRGRDRLRRRLIRAGVAPSLLVSAQLARGAMSEGKPLPAATVRMLTDRMTSGAVPESVRRLVQGGIRAMLYETMRKSAVALLAGGVLASGLFGFATRAAQDAPKPTTEPSGAAPAPASKAPEGAKEADPIREMTLPEAIRIGLENCEVMRVRPAGAEGSLITMRDPKGDPYRFRSEAMAVLRSIEQQYWALHLVGQRYWAAETASELTEQVLKREEAKYLVGEGALPNVAKAAEQLDRCKKEVVDRVAELIQTEHQLRRILGMPAIDGRRIVPTTPPRDGKLALDWEVIKAKMLEHHPELRRARDEIRAAGDQAELAEATEARGEEVRQQAEQSLAKMFLMVDTQYRLFQTATRLKEAARRRLEVAAGGEHLGKYSVEVHLDAIHRWSAAVAQEAEFKAKYNTALAGVEEAAGTLLQRDGVTVVEGPRADPGVVRTGGDGEKPAPAKVEDRSAFTFDLKLKIGATPIEFRGSFRIGPAAPAEEPK